MTTAIEDIPMTLAFLYEDMKGLRRQIKEGNECYARLMGLLRGYKAEITTMAVNSPVILVEIEEQLENMKTLIRTKREQINSDLALWHNMNKWKTELMHQVDSTSYSS